MEVDAGPFVLAVPVRPYVVDGRAVEEGDSGEDDAVGHAQRHYDVGAPAKLGTGKDTEAAGDKRHFRQGERDRVRYLGYPCILDMSATSI